MRADSNDLAKSTQLRWIRSQNQQIFIANRLDSLNQETRHNWKGPESPQTQNSDRIESFSAALDNVIESINQQTESTRQQLQLLTAKVAKTEIDNKQRRKVIDQRIRQIKTQIGLQMAHQKYTSDEGLKMAQNQFQRAQKTIQQSVASLSCSQETTKTIKNLNEAMQKLTEMRRQSAETGERSDKQGEECLEWLEQRVTEWRVKIQAEAQQQQQQRLEIQSELQQLIADLCREVQQQSQTREQNKEKLLILFENRLEQISKDNQK